LAIPNFFPMKARTILISIIILILVGCKRDPLPRKAIDDEKFIAILVDIHLAEALYQERTRIDIDSLKSESLYYSVLKKHKIPEEQMVATTLYYSRHPREYDKIFTEVLSRISARMEELEQPGKREEPNP